MNHGLALFNNSTHKKSRFTMLVATALLFLLVPRQFYSVHDALEGSVWLRFRIPTDPKAAMTQLQLSGGSSFTFIQRDACWPSASSLLPAL